MKSLTDSILRVYPNADRKEVEENLHRLISKALNRILGDVQSRLASYNLSRQNDLDLLRREIERIFLESEES